MQVVACGPVELVVLVGEWFGRVQVSEPVFVSDGFGGYVEGGESLGNAAGVVFVVDVQDTFGAVVGGREVFVRRRRAPPTICRIRMRRRACGFCRGRTPTGFARTASIWVRLGSRVSAVAMSTGAQVERSTMSSAAAGLFNVSRIELEVHPVLVVVIGRPRPVRPASIVQPIRVGGLSRRQRSGPRLPTSLKGLCARRVVAPNQSSWRDRSLIR